MLPIAEPVDLIEEFRLRRWARENYCYAEARQPSWHPIVHDEMQRQDHEGLSSDDGSLLSEYDDSPDPADSSPFSHMTDERIDITPAAAQLPLGPIVPLVPGTADIHGPHEITPPHTRIDTPAETPEMHYT